MTTLHVNDPAIESALADLALTAPPELAAEVLVEVGLADRYATIESPIGPLYVAWNGRGVSTVGLAEDDAAFEAEHLRQTGLRDGAGTVPLTARLAEVFRLEGCVVLGEPHGRDTPPVPCHVQRLSLIHI